MVGAKTVGKSWDDPSTRTVDRQGGSHAPDEEGALVERAKWDPEAFGELYERYCERIYAFAHARLGNRDDAQDATSDVFLKALRGIATYRRTEQPFRAWLYRIGHNVITDRYRRRRPAISIEQAPEVVLGSADFAEAVLDRVDMQAIWAAVDRLPGQQRMAITLHFLADLPNSTIAEVMHKSTPAIKLLIFRGMRTLRSRLPMDDAQSKGCKIPFECNTRAASARSIGKRSQGAAELASATGMSMAK